MATIKEYNNKLKSLKNTQKITKTMKMVAASKLRKAHEAQANAKLYALNLTALIARLSARIDASNHPLLLSRENPSKALIVIFTSDKGLCGAFNNNAIKHVLNWMDENREHFESIDLSFCGKRGYNSFKKIESVKKYYEGVSSNPQFSDAKEISNEISADFVSGEYDEVYLAYNQFFSPLSQKTIFEKVLPIEADILTENQDSSESENAREYLFEPQPRELLEFLIPHFIYFKIYFALLENSAGEHGARMTAMESATKNASELMDQYTLLRNRARQAAITTELTEIVAGAEALN